MKILISYKQTWVKEEELKNNLQKIRDALKNIWHETFIFYLDIEKYDWPKEIVDITSDEIEKSDLVVAFINHKDKSEGMLLELWIAKWLWKKIIVMVKDEFYDNYYLTYWLTQDVVKFDSLEEDFEEKLLYNIK